MDSTDRKMYEETIVIGGETIGMTGAVTTTGIRIGTEEGIVRRAGTTGIGVGQGVIKMSLNGVLDLRGERDGGMRMRERRGIDRGIVLLNTTARRNGGALISSYWPVVSCSEHLFTLSTCRFDRLECTPTLCYKELEFHAGMSIPDITANCSSVRRCYRLRTLY